MPYLTVSRDQRGYDTTLLMHSPGAGLPARILYYYRSAPEIRVGRPALDEDAIRFVEERYPEIEFDWPGMLESSAVSLPTIERRWERPRHQVRGPQSDTRGAHGELGVTMSVSQGLDASRPAQEIAVRSRAVPRPIMPAPATIPSVLTPLAAQIHASSAPAAVSAPPFISPRPLPTNTVLDELVGREIAARLRARYADIAARIAAVDDQGERASWQHRAAAADPDSWLTPEEVLRAVQDVDATFETLRKGLVSTGQG